MTERAAKPEIMAGNVFNKYGSSNPVVRWMMRSFEDSLLELVEGTGVDTIHEVGCGEGFLASLLAGRGFRIRASDISREIVEQARERARSRGLSIGFRVRSVYDLNEADAAPLVLCCEVLEHLERPGLAIERIGRIARPYAIFSVPREPLSRVLNLCRGKYLSEFGNTPGHLQHWSSHGFLRLLSVRFRVLDVKRPIPWTMALCSVS